MVASNRLGDSCLRVVLFVVVLSYGCRHQICVRFLNPWSWQGKIALLIMACSISMELPPNNQRLKQSMLLEIHVLLDLPSR